MHALKVALVALAVIALCSGEAAKKTKKSEKAPKAVRLSKDGKESKTHKRGLYPEPHLGSAYAVDGPAEFYLDPHDHEGHLDVHHDLGLYGGVYAGHVDPHKPLVVATYAPRYTHAAVGGYAEHTSYSDYGHGYLGGFPGGLRGLEALLGGVKVEHANIRVTTITKHVPVAVPHPVPVEVVKKVPVPVPHPVPVDVPRAVRVEVPQPYPVEVKKPYPVEVPKPVPHVVHVPVHVKVPKPYPVEVPTPYEVEVHRPVPVPVPHHVEVPHPVAVPVHHDGHHESYSTPAYAPSTEHAPAAYSTLVTPTVKPVTSTYAPVVAVTKCKEEVVQVTPAPVHYAKELKGYGEYHDVPYVTPAQAYLKSEPSYVSITPAPAYVTPAPYVKESYVAPAVYAKESYVTPAPYVKESYATPEPYVEEAYAPALYAKAVPHGAIDYVKHVPFYASPAPYVKGEHSYVTPASYVKPAPAYVTPAPYAAEHSYPKESYGYAPVYQPHGYGKGVATSFVGVTAHGNPSYAGYKSHVHHHTSY